jgi:hypothetical protein
MLKYYYYIIIVLTFVHWLLHFGKLLEGAGWFPIIQFFLVQSFFMRQSHYASFFIRFSSMLESICRNQVACVRISRR